MSAEVLTKKERVCRKHWVRCHAKHYQAAANRYCLSGSNANKTPRVWTTTTNGELQQRQIYLMAPVGAELLAMRVTG